MQVNVHIGHDDWIGFDGMAVDGTAVNLDNATKVAVELERRGESRDINDSDNPALFKVGSSSSKGTDGFEVNLGRKFTDDNEAGQEWEGRTVVFDATNTNGRRFGRPFKILLVK